MAILRPRSGWPIAVAATVVSDSVPNQVVIDAGAKSLTKDAPPYLAGFGTIPDPRTRRGRRYPAVALLGLLVLGLLHGQEFSG